MLQITITWRKKNSSSGHQKVPWQYIDHTLRATFLLLMPCNRAYYLKMIVDLMNSGEGVQAFRKVVVLTYKGLQRNSTAYGGAFCKMIHWEFWGKGYRGYPGGRKVSPLSNKVEELWRSSPVEKLKGAPKKTPWFWKLSNMRLMRWVANAACIYIPVSKFR